MQRLTNSFRGLNVIDSVTIKFGTNSSQPVNCQMESQPVLCLSCWTEAVCSQFKSAGQTALYVAFTGLGKKGMLMVKLYSVSD